MSTEVNSSDSDEFIDASEAFHGDEQNLDNGLYTAQKVLDFFLRNEYNNAQKLSENSNNIYVSLSHSSIKALESLSSFQTEDFKSAVTSLKSTNNLCNSLRNNEIKSRKLKSDFTDLNIHTELCYAESLLQLALVNIARDEKIITLMKSGLKIRECYKTYQWCWNYLNSELNTKKDYNFKEFECGVYFGYGLFNLMISSASDRILKLLQFVGFQGDKELGLKLLRKGATMTDNVRSVLCSLSLLCYNFYLVQLLDIETPENIAEGNFLLKIWFDRYPNSAFFLFYSGRASVIAHDLEKAKKYFDQSINAQSEWKNFHDICYWELMWCYAIEQDWWLALKYAERLLISSNWSQVIYRYLKSAFIYQFIEENRDSTDETICGVITRYHSHMEACLADIPNFKQKIAGKSIPLEKFLIKKSKAYTDSKRLSLPGIEMMYIWNVFKLIDKSSKHYIKLITVCRKTREKISATNNSAKSNEVGHAYFLEGCLFSQAGKDYANAQKIFEHVIKKYSTVYESESYIIPYTLFELANVYYNLGDQERCQELIAQIQKFKKFNLQNRLIFRMNGLLSKCKANDPSTSGTDIQLPSTSGT